LLGAAGSDDEDNEDMHIAVIKTEEPRVKPATMALCPTD
jgi:hypothetical protein